MIIEFNAVTKEIETAFNHFEFGHQSHLSIICHKQRQLRNLAAKKKKILTKTFGGELRA